MDREQAGSRIAALRAECVALGHDLAEDARGWRPEDCFEVAGELQGLVNAAEGAQGVVAGFGARVETTMTERGPSGRVHPVGFVDAMAAAEMSLASGVTEGLAGRKVALGAALGERFPQVRVQVLAGDVPTSAAQKVVDACAGLDIEACERVDAEVAGRLPAMDPARVTSAARRVASRVAGDQVEAQSAAMRRSRTVEVRPGEDGLSDWWALLPTATSAAAWSAVNSLAGQYRSLDPDLTLSEARADAFGDLLLQHVTVSARVTLGVPVITGTPASEPSGSTRVCVDWDDTDTVIDAETGLVTSFSDLTEPSREALPWVEVLDEGAQPGTEVVARARPGLAVSGTQLPGLGWVDASTVAGLLSTFPMDVARAVLDAENGTLVSLTSGAYRPPKAMHDVVTIRDGTCRMWGCSRAADRADLDHTRPWPAGPTTPANLVALCRRHHRMKQQGRWRSTLEPDGTLTWTAPTGTTRVTEPQHRST